jgi:hypothetical protein
VKFEKLTIKEKAYIATFGALWGGSEITLGMLLHNFRIPFTGFILTFIGAIIALTCLRLTGKKRTIIYVALIAATLKMLSFTTIKLGPIMGIVGSALLAQSVIVILNINFVSYALAAGAMCSWPFLQFLLNQVIIYTHKIFNIYQEFLINIGLKDLKVYVLFVFILIMHFVLGTMSGMIAWKLSSCLIQRGKINEKPA